MRERAEKQTNPEQAEKSIFDGLEGVYVGFSPTDESALVMGEIEMTITKDVFKIRMATGLKIQEEEIPIVDTGAEEIAKDELPTLFNDPDINLDGVRAFRVDSEPWLVFGNDNEDGASVRMFAGMAEYLGPTILFSPKQVEKGMMEKAVEEIEKEYGQIGVLPRLSNNGLAPNQSV